MVRIHFRNLLDPILDPRIAKLSPEVAKLAPQISRNVLEKIRTAAETFLELAGLISGTIWVHFWAQHMCFGFRFNNIVCYLCRALCLLWCLIGGQRSKSGPPLPQGAREELMETRLRRWRSPMSLTHRSPT